MYQNYKTLKKFFAFRGDSIFPDIFLLSHKLFSCISGLKTLIINIFYALMDDCRIKYVTRTKNEQLDGVN